MQAEERHQRIEEYLQNAEFASLDELAKAVDASVSTVRRDITTLELSGNYKRTHGGVRVVNPRSDEFAFASRDTHQLAEKEAIARLCAELISPHQTVIIDAGTTTFHVARQLETKAPQIITNSMPVANYFAAPNRVEVILSGGVLYHRLGVLVGPIAAEAFSKLHADVAIMSAGGITLEGITNSHALLIEIQRAMIKAAQKVIFCLDHTKFGRRSISYLCALKDVKTIVTDSNAPSTLLKELRRSGIDIHIAPHPG